uniref:Epimerase family protein SDR39U1 homologic isoform X3 n=1 Tax=Rhizophora mucronata TaxID=61149 RepID=A0A2P2LJ51_RHIMU
MVLSASCTKEYLNWKPNSLALVGSTFCPSKTCEGGRFISSSMQRKK